ncbi:MAG: class I SAM-dependent methyltransferase [Polyangiaceae bacterium]
MKAEESWKPSRFALKDGRFTVGPSVSSGSWLVTRLVAEAYERHLRQHARGRLVDLGCGPVPLYPAYRPLVSEVVCVDWGGSPHRGTHVDIEHDLNQPLPFADRAFDTVLLSDVLEHVQVPAALLAEISRVLAPGGKLILNVPFMYWLHELPHDYFRYTESSLRLLLERAGLSVRVLEALGGGVEVLADVLSKHVDRVPLLGKPLALALQRSVYLASRPGLARRALAQSRARFPLEYFVVAERP